MNQAVDRPAIRGSSLGVSDKARVKINARQPFHRLAHESRGKCVAASDFQDMLASGKHLCDEFVAREREGEPLRVVEISPGGHQSEPFGPLHPHLTNALLVLPLALGLRMMA